jgi:hypothetical protein
MPASRAAPCVPSYVQQMTPIDRAGVRWSGCLASRARRRRGRAVAARSDRLPITAGLDRWIKASFSRQPSAYFGSRVVGITQIASYGCRGRNGNSFGNISEHAFGNALDMAAFQFANGQQIVVVNDWWRGTPRERAFLQAIFAGACNEFYTVLGPGSDRFHYNHIHVDFLQSNASHGRHYCRPFPGAPIAEASEPSATASVMPIPFLRPGPN